MDMNTISGAFAYEKTTTSKLEESLTVTDKSVSYAKSVENKTEEAAAVVYEKSPKDAVKTAKANLDIVNKMKADEKHCSGCEHSNFCIGRMYSRSMQCHKKCEDITPGLVKAVEKVNRQNDKMERKLGYKK